MSIAVLMRTAWKALLRNVDRSLLTMLGIIIGVGAVIASMAIGAGAQAAVLKQIESLGANLIIITPGSITSGGVSLGSGSRTTLKLDDINAIATNVPEIARGRAVLADQRSGGCRFGQLVHRDRRNDPGLALRWKLERCPGDVFHEAGRQPRGEGGRVGEHGCRQPVSSGGAVGSTVVIKSVPFRVIGVLQSKGQTGFGRDQDDVVIVPITTHQERLTGQTWVNTIMISAATPGPMAGVVDSTERLLRLEHHLSPADPDDFTIRNIANVQAVRAATVQTQALLLAAVAVVSLIVGGIGIMNIMLVSVTERTREIGLRMAVGGRGRDILLQFLIEALTMACAGGLIGVGMGVGISFLVSIVGKWPTMISGFSVFLGFVSAALTGVVFGFYPARRAAALDPIDALRYE